MKKYILSKNMKKNYSTEDLRQYLSQKRTRPIIKEKIQAIKELIKKRELEDTKLGKELVNSPLWNLAVTLLKNKIQIKDFFANLFKSKDPNYSDLKKYLKEFLYYEEKEIYENSDKKEIIVDPASVILIMREILDIASQMGKLEWLRRYIKGELDVRKI